MRIITFYYDCIRSVPSQSTATIKLELLPLTDGIITLDTLQIDVKEKGIDLFIFIVWFLHTCMLELTEEMSYECISVGSIWGPHLMIGELKMQLMLRDVFSCLYHGHGWLSKKLSIDGATT